MELGADARDEARMLGVEDGDTASPFVPPRSVAVSRRRTVLEYAVDVVGTKSSLRRPVQRVVGPSQVIHAC